MTQATIGELMAEYAELRTRRDDIDAERKMIGERMDTIERACMDRMKNDGVSKTAACGFSLSLRDKYRAKYDPAKWPEVVRWAVESGNDHIIQRRLTDAKVMELFDNGVPFPDGLSVEPYTDLDVRRTA